MTAPLGSRVCPDLGCGRRIHVSPSGIVYARCLAHTLMLVSGAFKASERAPEAGVVPHASGVRSASSVRRPAA